MKTKTFSFTKKQLVKAFEAWDVDYLINPNNYCGDISPDRSKAQAKHLLRLLKAVTK